MAVAIKLPDDLIDEAKCYGKTYNRSISDQIEYWALIGKMAEENPDLPYCYLKEYAIKYNNVEEGFNDFD